MRHGDQSVLRFNKALTGESTNIRRWDSDLATTLYYMRVEPGLIRPLSAFRQSLLIGGKSARSRMRPSCLLSRLLGYALGR